MTPGYDDGFEDMALREAGDDFHPRHPEDPAYMAGYRDGRTAAMVQLDLDPE